MVGLAGFGIQDVLRTSGKNDVIRFADQKVSESKIDFFKHIKIKGELKNT